MLTVNKSMEVDVAMYGDKNVQTNFNVTLPVIVSQQRAANARRVYGLPIDITVKELVEFTHCIGHWSIEDMVDQCKCIANYPFTPSQVREYYPHTCVTCIKGKLRNRKASEVKPHEDPVEIVSTRKVKHKPTMKQVHEIVDLKQLEPRNLVMHLSST